MDWRHNPPHLAYPTTTKPRYVNDPTIVKCNVLSLLTRCPEVACYSTVDHTKRDHFAFRKVAYVELGRPIQPLRLLF